MDSCRVEVGIREAVTLHGHGSSRQASPEPDRGEPIWCEGIDRGLCWATVSAGNNFDGAPLLLALSFRLPRRRRSSQMSASKSRINY